MSYADSLARIAEADAAAEKAMRAFNSGTFEQYWHDQGEQARTRLEESYGKLSADAESANSAAGDPGPDSGTTAGSGDSGPSSRTGRSQIDTEGTPRAS